MGLLVLNNMGFSTFFMEKCAGFLELNCMASSEKSVDFLGTKLFGFIGKLWASWG